MKQVEKEHYDFQNYVSVQRWGSYYQQLLHLSEYFHTEAEKKILYIGKGDNTVPLLAQNFGGDNFVMKTFDFEEELKPDYVGDVREIDTIVKEPVSCICCCQVLEHLEWQYFEKCIAAFSELCEDKLILSLPQKRVKGGIWISSGGGSGVIEGIFPDLVKGIILANKRWKFDGQHYWEINYKGYPQKKILNVISKYFNIEQTYTVTFHAYHVFIIARKK